jgi:predicted Fe-S protein YdhL (DUF1289 family)
MPGIETPCTRVCVVHPTHQLCVGCGRTIEEIAHWIDLTDAERERIMTQLTPRLQALAGTKPASATA